MRQFNSPGEEQARLPPGTGASHTQSRPGPCGVRAPALRNAGPPGTGVNEATGSLLFLPRDSHDPFA